MLRPLGRAAARDVPSFADYPFKLGVASGDPVADGVVLWTRLAPGPYDPTLLPDSPVEVRWELASERTFGRLVRSGVALAHPERGHSVHVEVEGLEPGRDYFYRFLAGGEESPVGITRTLPLAGSRVDRFRLALVSCQSLTEGYFAAYRDVVEQAPQLVVHTGDYIYENDWIGGVRRIPVPEAWRLIDYRDLHARYKLDPDLQAAHAAMPWLLIWDDHEVANDWGGDHNEQGLSEAAFVERKRAAFQAYYEHLPLRLASRWREEEMRIYQRSIIGDLVELDLLDCRQYRDAPACRSTEPDRPRYADLCAEARDPGRSLLGAEQERWLERGFARSGAHWNVLVQTTMLAPFDYLHGDQRGYDLEEWDGFAAPRQRILDLVARLRPSNPLSVGGNIHAFYGGVVCADPFDAATEPRLAELVCTSISAGGGGDERYRDVHRQFAENPCARYFENRRRGYLLCDVDRERWQARLRVVADVLDPKSASSTLDTLTVADGKVEVLVG